MKTINKSIIKKSLINSLITSIIIATILFLIINLGIYTKISTAILSWVSKFIIAYIIVFITNILMYNSFEKKQVSIKIVDDNLSCENYTKVEPVNIPLYTSFFNSISDISDFYAIINKDIDRVQVFVKFHFDDRYIKLQTLEKSQFTSFFKIYEEELE